MPISTDQEDKLLALIVDCVARGGDWVSGWATSLRDTPLRDGIGHRMRLVLLRGRRPRKEDGTKEKQQDLSAAHATPVDSSGMPLAAMPQMKEWGYGEFAGCIFDPYASRASRR